MQTQNRNGTNRVIRYKLAGTPGTPKMGVLRAGWDNWSTEGCTPGRLILRAGYKRPT